MKRITSVLTCGAMAVPAVYVGADLIETVRGAGSTYELQVTGVAGVPADAEAVVLNLTSADARGTGFLTAYACGAARPNASNLNYGQGAPVANSAIVKVGTGGKVCLFTADADTELIADVNGWFPAGSGYTSTTPSRLLDTRPGLSTVDGIGDGEGVRRAGMIYELQVAGRAGVPANAAAVVLNLTSAEARGTGFVAAYPCGAHLPNASNLNYRVGAPVANSAIVKVGSGGKVCLLTADADTELIADVNGYFPTSGYEPMTPSRLMDTRRPQSTVDNVGAGEGLRRAGTIYELQVGGRAGVPANAAAVVLNLTSAEARGTGFMTAYPCGGAIPNASNLNYGVGAPVANSAIVKVGAAGKVCLFTADTDTHVIADVNGYFPAGSNYNSMTPTRLLDTRNIPAPPSGAAFVETFAGNGGLDRFDVFAYHRNLDVGYPAGHGGSWSGDHDLACGMPDTQRALSSSSSWTDAQRAVKTVYVCRDHMMSSMGDVDGYSVVAFSPAQVFNDVSSVSFEVNLTDLGTRQWWKVGVLSVADCPALDERCMYSDVDASSLPSDLKTSGHVMATWSGGISAGHPGGLMIGNQSDPGSGGFVSFDAGSDKMTRHPVTLSDNGAGTLTFNVAGKVKTAPGSFPACPCRVVFYDHNYTPEKSESGPPIGFTWHWDNIIVE